MAKKEHDGIVETPTVTNIHQLPHAEGLALPAFQSAGAAGLDLLAAVPAETPLILRPADTR
jgi:dUTP pyrophosphatase